VAKGRTVVVSVFLPLLNLLFALLCPVLEHQRLGRALWTHHPGSFASGCQLGLANGRTSRSLEGEQGGAGSTQVPPCLGQAFWVLTWCNWKFYTWKKKRKFILDLMWPVTVKYRHTKCIINYLYYKWTIYKKYVKSVFILVSLPKDISSCICICILYTQNLKFEALQISEIQPISFHDHSLHRKDATP
jgi:hypothetical protein